MVVVGSFLEISRIEDAADFEWRIPGSDTERLGRGESLESPPIHFERLLCWFELRRMDQSSDDSPLALTLSIGTSERGRVLPSVAYCPVIRYWMGVVKEDGGRREEVEMRRGHHTRAGYGYSINVHEWMRFCELRRWMGCSAPSPGTLSFILRLRTGPERDVDDDDEMRMRSLEERKEPVPSLEATAGKCTQTDIEDVQMNSEGVSKSAARREESTQTYSEDVQTNSEDVSNSAARREVGRSRLKPTRGDAL